MLTDNKHKIFVYGTLRPRDDNGNYVPATHMLNGYGMYNYHDRFPYIETSWNGYVVGNVIEVTDEELVMLDRYEGVPNSLYLRIKETVEPFEGDEDEDVWVYIADAISIRVPSGDWTDV
jgi:gamma-glutamylcyclotransferase (GGCT)/AIG2-like uncharacterized protein YtfP